MNWSDTPPTVAGDYRVKNRVWHNESVATLNEHGWTVATDELGELPPEEVLKHWQFGRRVPTNAELGELPGLIEEYGLRCKAYGLAIQSLGSDEQFGLRMMRDEMLAKINAILGVRNDAGAS